MPLLIGDEKNLDMPFTKEATLRTHQEKLKKFLGLVESLMVDSKIKMVEESIRSTIGAINEENENYEKQVISNDYKHTFKGKQYIEISLQIDDNEELARLTPSEEDICDQFEYLLNKGLLKLYRTHKKL